MNAELKIQEAIFGLLSGSPGVDYEVYDDVPQDGTYPYIVIGEASSGEFDTKTFNGFETGVVIHSWSRYDGRQEVKEMMGAVYAALHNVLIEVEDFNTVLCLFEFSETLLEDDGITRHGIQRFNLVINEE